MNREQNYIEPITISIEIGGSGFVVAQGNRTCDGLGWDEMLGQIVALTHRKIREPHYAMLTPAEHVLEAARRAVRRAEMVVETERASAPVSWRDLKSGEQS